MPCGWNRQMDWRLVEEFWPVAAIVIARPIWVSGRNLLPLTADETPASRTVAATTTGVSGKPSWFVSMEPSRGPSTNSATAKRVSNNAGQLEVRNELAMQAVAHPAW